MTLVVALRCREGAVLACDSQVTQRAVQGRVTGADRHTKLIVHRGALWAWAGRPDAAQRFAVLATEHADVRAGAKRLALQDAIEGCARGALEKIDGVADLGVLLAVWDRAAKKAVILRVYDAGGAVASVWVDDLDNVSMLGSSQARRLAQHALRTMGFADFRDVGLEEARTLAYKLIADVAASTDDVGEPILIGSVTASKTERLDEADTEGARDSAGRFTSDIRGLVASEILPADTDTADKGVGPPG